IYAVILGTGVNQDGHTHGLTVPSEAAQTDLLRQVYREAGVSPERVVYVEAHGTGTPVGDPIEANAIGAALGTPRVRGHRLRVGSVKTNIGPLEPASGIAGLIKAALSLKPRELVPNLHFREPNPAIPFEGLNLAVQQTLDPWTDEAGSAVI